MKNKVEETFHKLMAIETKVVGKKISRGKGATKKTRQKNIII